GLLVAVLLVLSLPWPLIQDAPVMHYIAWRIGEGDVPYRDLYDINQPGVYVLHLALLRTLGAGDGAWRAFDLAWLAATAGPGPPPWRPGSRSRAGCAPGSTSSSATPSRSTAISGARRRGSATAGSAGSRWGSRPSAPSSSRWRRVGPTRVTSWRLSASPTESRTTSGSRRARSTTSIRSRPSSACSRSPR